MNEILEYINENLDVKSKIVADIKKKGYNTRQVSVKQDREAIFLTIRDYNVKISDIDSIAKKYDNYETDGQGSIMSGGNTYVFVKVNKDTAIKLKDFFVSKTYSKIKKVIDRIEKETESNKSNEHILYNNKGYKISIYLSKNKGFFNYSVFLTSDKKNLTKSQTNGYGDDPKDKTESITINDLYDDKALDLNNLVASVCLNIANILIKTEQVDIFTDPKGFKFKNDKILTLTQVEAEIKKFLKKKYNNDVVLSKYDDITNKVNVFSQINFLKVKDEIIDFISKVNKYKTINSLVWIDMGLDDSIKDILNKDATMIKLIDRIKDQFVNNSLDILNHATIYKDKYGNIITIRPEKNEFYSLNLETKDKTMISLYDGKKVKDISFLVSYYENKFVIVAKGQHYSIEEAIFFTRFPLYKDGVKQQKQDIKLSDMPYYGAKIPIGMGDGILLEVTRSSESNNSIGYLMYEKDSKRFNRIVFSINIKDDHLLLSSSYYREQKYLKKDVREIDKVIKEFVEIIKNNK